MSEELNNTQDYSEYMNDPMVAHMKQQWEAMGLTPEVMAQCMDTLIASRKNSQQQIQQAMQANPFLNQDLSEMQEGLASSANMAMMDMFSDAPHVFEDPDTNEEETKALLCGANLIYHNHGYLNSLTTVRPGDDKPYVVEDILQGLEYMWGVTNREELIETLDWLENEGHKIYFDLIWQTLRPIPVEGWVAAVQQLDLNAMAGENLDPERLAEFLINFVNHYPILAAHKGFENLKELDISAWDFARAINLCRFGYDIDYLSREEAMDRIMGYAQKMYGIYDSWEALSFAYLTGCAMWTDEEDTVETRLEHHDVLLSHESSPWTKINW